MKPHSKPTSVGFFLLKWGQEKEKEPSFAVSLFFYLRHRGSYGISKCNMKRLLLSTVLLFGLAGSTIADIQAPPASEYTATRKLGRAIGNIFFAIEELPVTIMRWNDTEGNYAGASVGVVDGIARTFTRIGYGFYELVTFWAPTYKCTYRPPYQGSCGRNGLKEYNAWSGFSEFPEEISNQSKYSYTRQNDN